MEDVIAPGKAARQGQGDIAAHELETRAADEMADVFFPARDEAVQADDPVSALQEEIAKVGTHKTGSAGDDRTHQ